ncbi:hypothetical protein Tco_1115136 [Tanacetum coccineum]
MCMCTTTVAGKLVTKATTITGSMHQGHSTLSLEDSLSRDCDVEKNDVGMLDKFDRGLQIDVQVFVNFDYAMGLKEGNMAKGTLDRVKIAKATSALVKGGSRSKVPAQVEVVAYAAREPKRTHLLLRAGTKSPLSADTFGNSGVDELETSGPETPAKKVVGNEGYMVDALSRVLEQKNSKKGVDTSSGRQTYTLFGASLFAFLNFGPGYFARRRIWDPGINISSRNTLRARWL